MTDHDEGPPPMDPTQDTPQGTGDRLFRVLSDRYELAPHEELMVRMACDDLNKIDQLELQLAVDGLTDEKGKIRPAQVEVRLLKVNVSRLLAGAGLPADAGDEAGGYNAQAPRGPRGNYRPRGLRSIEGEGGA